MASKKVLLYLSSLSKPVYGNTQSNLQLMEGFLESGYEVVFVVNRKTANDVDVPVKVVGLGAKGDFDRPFKLAKVIREERPKAVIASMYTQILTTSLARKFLKGSLVKFIGVCRDVRHWHNRWWKLPFRFFVKSVFESMDYMVAVSETVKESIVNIFFVNEDKVKVIYNPFDIDRIRERSREKLSENYERLFQENSVLLVVGRLEEQKAPYKALEVFRLIPNKNNLILVFLGEGRLRESLEEMTGKLGLRDKVFFLGFQENPFKFMSRAKLLLHTAEREGFARSLVESVILRLPIVALYNEMNSCHIINAWKVGEAVPYDKPEMLAERISSIINDKELLESYKKNCTAKAKDFDREKIIKEYIDLIEG